MRYLFVADFVLLLFGAFACAGKRSFPKDILPIYTRDVACIIIQRKWRAILVKQFLRALVRAQHDEVWDPVKGRFNYYHRDSETLHQEKPKLLGENTRAVYSGIIHLLLGSQGFVSTVSSVDNG
jgi:hypothetical protein